LKRRKKQQKSMKNQPLTTIVEDNKLMKINKFLYFKKPTFSHKIISKYGKSLREK